MKYTNSNRASLTLYAIHIAMSRQTDEQIRRPVFIRPATLVQIEKHLRNCEPFVLLHMILSETAVFFAPSLKKTSAAKDFDGINPFLFY